MSKKKYDKYIITEFNKPKQDFAWGGTYRLGDKTPLLYLDTDVIEGAFYIEVHWFWPAMAKNKSEERKPKPHIHDYDEVLALIGTDPDDPKDLCGECEAWLGGEKQIINKSCMIFIPKGLEHGPISMNRIDRPILHFSCGTAKRH